MQTAELPELMWEKRLALEYKLMRENEPLFDIVDNDLTHYMGVIVGSGIYENGYFRVEIFVPRSFPFTPPEIIWHTRIWHPNFSDDQPARICESLLKADWSPSIHLFSIIETLRNLLNEPNPDDPLNSIAAMELKYNPDIFKAHVKQYILAFAKEEQAFI
ncbi:MAG: ubiquitin-conjugating enzyme family protein [Nitrososphaerota archaeon]